MAKPPNRDHYLDPATGVFRNKLGITDAETLKQLEADYAAARSYELAQNPLSGGFDLAHLQAIHKTLFSDLYDWAGELRTIDISKGQSYFAHHAHLESAAQAIFSNLAAEKVLAGSDRERFSERAAYYLGEINALHPFREGNGRTQREFINHLAYENGYCIEWKNIASEEMVQASIESFKGNSTKFAALIHQNLCDGFADASGRITTGNTELPQHQEPATPAPASYQELMRQDVGNIEPPEPLQEMER